MIEIIDLTDEVDEGKVLGSPLPAVSHAVNSLENICAHRSISFPYTFSLVSSHLMFKSQPTNWSCGYTNIHMMIDTCAQMPLFTQNNPQNALIQRIYREGMNSNVAIDVLQEVLEMAWDEGFDTAGAQDLGRIRNTKKWIGATEAISILRFLGIDARVVDFKVTTTTETLTSPFFFVILLALVFLLL